jgi:RNA polymerase sigma-70 factor (ECF subfamily)
MSEPDPDTLQTELLSLVPNLRAFAVSLCGDMDRADDLVQETLIKSWRNLDSFTQGTNLKAWLFTILRNTHFSALRKSRREVADVDGELTAGLTSPPAQLGHMDFADFKKALAQLSDDQREALVLIGAEGMSYEEVAEICGCAVGTIKSRVNRARVRLAELMHLEDERDFGPDRTSAALLTSGAFK